MPLIMKSKPFGNVEENKQMYELVKPEVKLLQNKSPEEKEYLVCLNFDDNDTGTRQWNIYKGRTETYERIKEQLYTFDFGITGDALDIYESFILVEGAKLEERVRLYDFMKHCEKFYNDGFNIDDYINHEDDTESDNIANQDRVDTNLLNMIAIMNNECSQQDIV